ncbi:MAG: dolichyl-phosphate beta-glucosyltransferase [bacterium]
MAQSKTVLSVVIPAFNEEQRLPSTLKIILKYLRQTSFGAFEIVVVNDGSTDRTSEIAKSAGPEVRIIDLPRPKGGKGRAVKAGVLASQGEWILLSDSDLSTPIETLERFWTLRQDYDIIIGSRALPDSIIVKRQNRIKVGLGRLGNKLTQWLVVPGMKDTQCGFKLYRRRCHFLFQKQKIIGWGFDFEILYLARKYGFRMIEVPVRWTNDQASKVRPYHYLLTFIEIFTVRLNHIRGLYR